MSGVLANGPLFLQDFRTSRTAAPQDSRKRPGKCPTSIAEKCAKEAPVLRLSSLSGNKTLSRTFVFRVFTAVVWVGVFSMMSGCELNDFLNPAEPKIVDPNQKPLLIPVLDTLASGIEEPDTAFSNASDIEPSDLVPDISDYKIGPNDMLSISVYDLMGEGTGETVKEVRVTETGMVSLPFISPVKADGLTERETEQAIQKAYEDARLIRGPRFSDGC